MKIGRNEPCYCGSGRKYKKCCLSKDKEVGTPQVMEEYDQDQEHACVEMVAEDPDAGAFTHVGSQGFNAACAGRDDKTSDDWHSDVDGPLPSLSEADQKIVDDWWDAMRPIYKKQGADEMIPRVLEFHESRPDLFEHLYLHQELLFELGAMLGRQGQPARYAELLMRLRREQPGMYRRSFGYYDRDVITELVVQNRRAEIPEYYDLFLKYPDRHMEDCYHVIDLLAWRGMDAELFALVTAKALRMKTTRNMIGGNFVPEWLVLRVCQPYLVAPDLSPGAAEIIFRDFQSWDQAIRPAITRDRIDEILQLARQAPAEEVFKKGHGRKPEDYTRLHGAFLRFLQNDRGLPWLSARFLADRLSSIWQGYRRNNHAGDVLYPPSNELEKYLVRSCARFFWFDGVGLLSALQALALFGCYLGKAGVLSESEETSWDAGIADLYEKARGSVAPSDCANRIYTSYASLRCEEEKE